MTLATVCVAHPDGARPWQTNQSIVKMNTLQLLLLGIVLTTPAFAGEALNEADQKWTAAVEKIIAAGNTTISTPSEKRVELAKQLAQKAGRKVEVSKSESSYRIKVL